MEERNGTQTLERVERPEQSLVIPSYLPDVQALIDEYAELSVRDRQYVTPETLSRWASDLVPGDYSLADVIRLEKRRQASLATLNSDQDLTELQWKLLRYLKRNEGRTMSYLQIARHLWNTPEYAVTARSLATQNGYQAPMVCHIQNLVVYIRKAIEIDPLRPQHIANVRGVGYRWYSLPPAKDDGEDYAKRALESSQQREQIQREFGLVEGSFVAIEQRDRDGVPYETRLALGPAHPDFEE